MGGEYAPEILADLEHSVKRGLHLWTLSADASIRLLNVSENATFELSEPSPGRRVILRVHRVGYSSAAEICSELQWIDSLRRDGVIETAAPIPGRNGGWVQLLESPSGQPSRHAVAFERLPGQEPVPGVDAVPWFERLGEVTARMHRHAKSWHLPAGFTRKRWDLDSMVGPTAYWGPWQAGIGLNRSGTEVIQQALASIRQRLERYGTGTERFGL